MNGDEINSLVRRHWRLMAAHGLTDGDALEVVMRLFCSVALASTGGDPQAACGLITDATNQLLDGVRSGKVKVTQIVNVKDKSGDKNVH